MRAAWRNEAAFRLEVLLCVVLVPLGWRLGETGEQRALLCGSVLLVPVIELVNSSLEAIVDLASPQQHPLAKAAKDLGSAAVLAASLVAALVWLAVLA